MTLSFDALCAEIPVQTELLRAAIADADLDSAVAPSPQETLRDLLGRVGGGHRWAADIVRTRAAAEPSPAAPYDIGPTESGDVAEISAWLAEGASMLATELVAAGSDVGLWTPTSDGTTNYYARRFAVATALERADATLAAGDVFDIDPALAAAAIDDWLDGVDASGLLGADRTIHLHATDEQPDPDDRYEWVIDLTGDAFAWRRSHEKSAVALRAPVAELLAVLSGRRRASGEECELLGDEALLTTFISATTAP